MKRALIVVLVAAFAFAPAAPAWAQIPDAAASTVAPWDAYGRAFMAPGTGGDLVTITVVDAGGTALPNIAVQVDVSACVTLCIDTPPGLAGVTNAAGVVVLDPRVGGCETCTVRIFAAGILLRTYTQVVSADWDGMWGDGHVGSLDFQYLQASMMSGAVCADYDGNGIVDLVDMSIFQLCANATNTNVCPNPQACGLNCPQVDGVIVAGGGGNRSPDMSGDGTVDLIDLSQFAAAYTPRPYNMCADFNCDGVVDIIDLSRFAAHYLHTGLFPGICY
jgi:hypothetical protein